MEVGLFATDRLATYVTYDPSQMGTGSVKYGLSERLYQLGQSIATAGNRGRRSRERCGRQVCDLGILKEYYAHRFD